MFFEDLDLFGEPVDHRRTRGIGDVSDVTSRMDGVRKGGQNKRGQQRNRKPSKDHRPKPPGFPSSSWFTAMLNVSAVARQDTHGDCLTKHCSQRLSFGMITPDDCGTRF